MKAKTAKEILRNESIPYWKLAKAMDMSESSVYRMLRDDEGNLSCENESSILKAINTINIERRTKDE